jgi:hypothetical protein
MTGDGHVAAGQSTESAAVAKPASPVSAAVTRAADSIVALSVAVAFVLIAVPPDEYVLRLGVYMRRAKPHAPRHIVVFAGAVVRVRAQAGNMPDRGQATGQLGS